MPFFSRCQGKSLDSGFLLCIMNRCQGFFPDMKEAGVLAREELERKVDLAFLAAFYGGLLTEHQRRVLSLYCEEDLSLGEIAEEVGASRQSVHEALSRAEAKLFEMEASLGVAARFRRMEAGLEAALRAVREKDNARAERLLEELLRLDQEESNGL